MKFLSTKSSGSRSEESRLSTADRQNEKTFFRGGTNAIIRRALEKELEAPLFPAALGKTGKLSRRPLVRTDAADMLKRRLKQAGLPAHYSPHSSGRPASQIFWKMTAPLKPLSGSPVTPIVGPRNCMTAAVRRCSWRTWRGFGTKHEFPPNGRPGRAWRLFT
jgi:hypothetical protein